MLVFQYGEKHHGYRRNNCGHKTTQIRHHRIELEEDPMLVDTYSQNTNIPITKMPIPILIFIFLKYKELYLFLKNVHIP